MGGNALKEYNTVRLDRKKANYFAHEAHVILRSLSEGKVKIKPIRSYSQKVDFGDMDLVVEESLFLNLSTTRIVEAFENFYGEKVPFVKNGPVLSLALPIYEGKRFQVDLISVPVEAFDFAYNYFSYNDLGNLIGRIAHKFGLKFGHDGLAMVIRDNTHVIGTLVLTTDFDRALSFLGYDEKRYAQGFDSIEDIFKFVASSRYFDPKIYNLENRNHTARVRDKKRPTYTAFLEWCDTQDFESYEFNADKSVYVPSTLEYFYAEKRYADIMAAHDIVKQTNAHFNGSLVNDITKLIGKDLGMFMKHLKTCVFPFNAGDAVLSLSSDELNKRIYCEFEEWKNGIH